MNGQPKKMRFGAWMGTAMGLLAKLKFVRGTALDVFGYTQERKTERELVLRYKAALDQALDRLMVHKGSMGSAVGQETGQETGQEKGDSAHQEANQDAHWQQALEAAKWADQIRGFGWVKESAIQKAGISI